MLQVPTDSSRYSQQSSPPKTDTDWSDRSQETWNSSDSTPSSLSMLTKCFDKVFADLYLQVKLFVVVIKYDMSAEVSLFVVLF